MDHMAKSHYTINDDDADRFFAEIEKAENHINPEKLRLEHGEEQFYYEASSYSIISDFLEQFSPQQGEVVYDLGSGFGRVVIFGALNSEAEFRGIEISELRTQKAELLAKQLGLTNTAFYAGNVLDFDLSEGDIFFLFNPFNPPTLAAVTDKLEKISHSKKIRIASWGGPSDDYLLGQLWLKHLPKSDPESPIEYFESA